MLLSVIRGMTGKVKKEKGTRQTQPELPVVRMTVPFRIFSVGTR